jgi:uncharacterized membrane protein YphA (DoxX/SURF4 family)
MLDERLNQSWWALRLSFGLVPIIAGLDKFTNLLTNWTQYLSPLALSVIPVSASTFMHVVGIIEIVAGLLVLTKFTRIGAYIVCAWMVAIALNLLTTGRFFDIAVRDLVMAVGAFSLGRMTEVREAATRRATTVTREPLTPKRPIPV